MSQFSLDFVLGYFAPLGNALSDRDDLETLLAKIGLGVGLNEEQAQALQDLIDIKQEIEDLLVAGEALAEAARDSDEGFDAAQLTPLVASAFALVQQVLAFKNSVSADDLLQFPAPLSQMDQWRSAIQRLPEVLLMDWLAAYVPVVYAPLRALGIIEEDQIAGFPGALDRVMRWDQLGALLDDPGGHIAGHHDWGGTFSHNDLIYALKKILHAFGLRTEYRALSGGTQAVLRPNGTDGQAFELALATVKVPLPDSPLPMEAQLILAGRSQGTEVAASGLGLTVLASRTLSHVEDLGRGFEMHLDVAGTLDGSVGIAIHPSGPEVFGAIPDLTANFGLNWAGDPQEPLILFGETGKSRLELTKFGVEMALEVATADVSMRIDAGGATRDGLRAVISLADADGFLKSLLGDQSFEITTGFGITASGDSGIAFEGGVGFEIVRSLGIDIGPFSLQGMRLAVGAGAEGIDGVVTVTGGADLSVIQFVVDDIGIRVQLCPTEEGVDGTFGNLDLKVGFKPPVGVGFGVDIAKLITGGAYLEINPEIGRYAGVGAIKILKFGLTAVAIIETRLPNDAEGWSIYVAVFVEFPEPGISLFPSMFLSGIGGMLGINRTVDVDVLFDRLIEGALDSILFPQDPILNAPQIIEDTAAIFPAAPDQFLFGAMVKLTWSKFVEGTLGIAVELPDPLRIVTIGQMKIGLPAVRPPEDVPKIVSLNMDVAGVIDFTNGWAQMSAVLRDSFIGLDPDAGFDGPRIVLSGGMALKATFNGKRQLILSVGGFHPDYTPPEGFDTPDRIRAGIPVGDIADVSLSGYFAVAPGALMAGGRVDIAASFAGFQAEGYMGFDAIIFTNPFGFDFRTEFGMSISKGRFTIMSVDVTARITGPRPIEIWADATFELCGFDKTIDLYVTTDGNRPARPAAVSLSALLYEEFSKPEAIQINPPADLSVVLVDGSETVDPAATVELTQSLAPLREDLELYLGAPIEGARWFEFNALLLDGSPIDLTETEDVQDWFPYVEYFDLDEEEKLAHPSFDEMVGGIAKSAGDATLSGPGRSPGAGYDEIVIDQLFGQRIKRPGKALDKNIPIARHLERGPEKGVSIQKEALSGVLPFVV
jgi:hypothetical protein